MIPLKDDIPNRTFPFVTLALIGINTAIYLWGLTLAPEALEDFTLSFALVPYEVTHLNPMRMEVMAYNVMTLVTSMFLHGGLFHLMGNMLYLWIFGDNIEDILGHTRFLVFYLVCGLAGAALQIGFEPESRTPMIGASGAIAGVLGAFLVMFPTARVLTLIFLVVFVRIVPIPALIVLGIWILIQLINAAHLGPAGVAWFAHIGGFLGGVLLIAPFRRHKVRHSLF